MVHHNILYVCCDLARFLVWSNVKLLVSGYPPSQISKKQIWINMYSEHNWTFYIFPSFVWIWPRAKSEFTLHMMTFYLWFLMFMTAYFYPCLLWSSSLNDHFCDSEVHDPSQAGPLCTCGPVGYGASIILLFSVFVMKLCLCLIFLLGSSLRHVVKHVLLINNLITYFVIEGLLLFIYNSSTI